MFNLFVRQLTVLVVGLDNAVLKLLLEFEFILNNLFHNLLLKG